MSSLPPHSLTRPRVAPQDRRQMGALSAVAGFVDAAGFVTLFGLFPAHLTGELVAAAVALVKGRIAEESLRLAIVPVFIVSVMFGALAVRICRKRRQSPLAMLLSLMALTLTVFSFSGVLLPAGSSAGRPLAFALREGCAVAAMGFQNVLMRQILTTSCPTTVMTGNLTQFIIELVEHGARRIDARREQTGIRRKPDLRLRLVATALGAFLLGALLGAWLTKRWGTICITLPAAVTAALAWREARQPVPATYSPSIRVAKGEGARGRRR